MKKLIFLAILMFSFVGFGQHKVFLVHNTGNSNGLEFTYGLKDAKNSDHHYSIGAGATTGCDFNTGYVIATKDITNYFSVGGKIGGWSDNQIFDHTKLYYAGVVYLQLEGKAKGWTIGWGVDRFNHCTYILGYKFK